MESKLKIFHTSTPSSNCRGLFERFVTVSEKRPKVKLLNYEVTARINGKISKHFVEQDSFDMAKRVIENKYGKGCVVLVVIAQ